MIDDMIVLDDEGGENVGQAGRDFEVHRRTRDTYCKHGLPPKASKIVVGERRGRALGAEVEQ